MLARIVRWSLERPRLIAWTCFWFLLWGVFYMRDARFDLLPDLAPAETSIRTEAPGLVADQVETLVTQPLESVLMNAAGVTQVRSESVQGLSTIVVRFDANADFYRVRQALSENLAAVTGALPEGVAPPRLAPPTASDVDVIKIGFTSDKLDPMALRDLVQWTVRPRLLSASGVARVAVYGGQIRRIEVRARPADLSDSDLGFLDILKAVRRATSVAGAGFIDTAGQRVLIEPRGQALTVDEVGAGQIQTAGGAPVRIADVADVVEGPSPEFGDALVMGRPAVLVEITRDYGANILETTHNIERALAVLQPSLAAQGVKVRTDLDRPASFATRALRGVAGDLAIGAALIAFVLVLFLRDARAVLVSLITIPISLLASTVVLKAFGLTINSMILGGLAVGLGVVIDDAVIGVDNVVARLREAEHNHASDFAAVLNATLEVRGPVIYGTMAAIIALAPLLALKGLQGAMLAPLAGAVITVLLASLLVATVVTPALSLVFHQHEEPPPESPLLERVKDIHAAWLSRLCARPLPVLVVSGAFVVAAVAMLAIFRSELLPSVSDSHLVAQVSAPPSTAPSVMRDYGIRINTELSALPGVRAVSQRIGRDASGDDSWGPERSVFDIELDPKLDAASQRALARRVLAALRLQPGLHPIVRSRFDAGLARLQTAAPVQISVYGQDLDAIDAAADRIAGVIRALPGARDVQAPDAMRAPLVRADLNFNRLALYGLSSADVLDTVQAAFAGERVAQIYEGGRIIDLAVSAQATLRRDPEAVGDLLLRSTSGVSVPLKAVANVYLTDGRAMIAHDGGLRRQVISANPSDPGGFVRLARRAIAAKVTMPPGAFIEFGGASQATADAQRDLLINYGFVIFGILALLAITFDARTGALIMTSSLFSFVGAAAAVWLMGGMLTVGAIVGFIALFALSMRGAILLFGRLEDVVLAHPAAWSRETVVRVTRDRLTPLLITSLLVALGLAPLAVHAGDAGREVLGPMAIVILGGLVTGTFASLFILPAMILAFWRPAYARRAHRSDGGAGHTHG
ncbi:MAG TPA: efflux RND transporter permease subunit [Caulobacteraceae bacterium]|jgi:CzcA family heavy metal efflux pump|nr:efflux RND transporter permease subunit [Caulobacteraceae bacterium]